LHPQPCVEDVEDTVFIAPIENSHFWTYTTCDKGDAHWSPFYQPLQQLEAEVLVQETYKATEFATNQDQVNNLPATSILFQTVAPR